MKQIEVKKFTIRFLKKENERLKEEIAELKSKLSTKRKTNKEIE